MKGTLLGVFLQQLLWLLNILHRATKIIQVTLLIYKNYNWVCLEATYEISGKCCGSVRIHILFFIIHFCFHSIPFFPPFPLPSICLQLKLVSVFSLWLKRTLDHLLFWFTGKIVNQPPLNQVHLMFRNQCSQI